MQLSRRHALQAGGALAATAIASSIANAADEPLPIIDCHQHLWDLDKFKLPWLKPGGKIGRSFVTKDYLEAVKDLNVVKAIYMEVDVAADQKIAEAEYVLGLTKDPKNLTTKAVIGGTPGTEGFAAYAERFKDEPKIVGFRQVLHGDLKAGTANEKAFVRDVQFLGKLGKTFDLCMRPAELGDAVKLIDACPDTRFILDHCGNAPVAEYQKPMKRLSAAIAQYENDIAALAKRKNVICKISGIAAQLADTDWTLDALAGPINHCLDSFGPDRVVFASDWPVCLTAVSLKQWVDGLKKIVSNRPLEEQKKLFHDNAKKFYDV
jgi:predicted TIM-barrel fold metal-dependent hydrolase